MSINTFFQPYSHVWKQKCVNRRLNRTNSFSLKSITLIKKSSRISLASLRFLSCFLRFSMNVLNYLKGNKFSLLIYFLSEVCFSSSIGLLLFFLLFLTITMLELRDLCYTFKTELWQGGGDISFHNNSFHLTLNAFWDKNFLYLTT